MDLIFGEIEDMKNTDPGVNKERIVDDIDRNHPKRAENEQGDFFRLAGSDFHNVIRPKPYIFCFNDIHKHWQIYLCLLFHQACLSPKQPLIGSH